MERKNIRNKNKSVRKKNEGNLKFESREENEE